jgi:uncharacterized protein (DUF302 family)
MNYAFSVTINQPIIAAKETLLTALQTQKLGIVSEVNVQAIMQNKLNLTIAPYLILGACAPGLAKRVLDADPVAGALLPCNIVLQQTAENATTISFMSAPAVLGLAEHSEIDQVAAEAHALLTKVCEQLQEVA